VSYNKRSFFRRFLSKCTTGKRVFFSFHFSYHIFSFSLSLVPLNPDSGDPVRRYQLYTSVYVCTYIYSIYACMYVCINKCIYTRTLRGPGLWVRLRTTFQTTPYAHTLRTHTHARTHTQTYTHMREFYYLQLIYVYIIICVQERGVCACV